MIKQTYEIRRNIDGEMLYIDAKELVDLCLDNGILQGEKGAWIAIYHQASKTNPKEYPKGWYKDDYEETIHEVMKDDNAINLFLNTLSENNILFVPSLSDDVFNFFDNNLIRRK